MTTLSSLYVLIFPENRVLKIGKANSVCSRSQVLKRHWGVPDYAESYELTAPQATVFKLEKTLHYLLSGHQVPFSDGDGRTELFALDALDLALKHIELFIASGTVNAVLTKGVCASEVLPAPKQTLPAKRILSSKEKEAGLGHFGGASEVDQSGPVRIRQQSHLAWARLTNTNPMASALLHKLMAKMDKQFTVTASYAALAELMRCSTATIKRAVDVLKRDAWIEVHRLRLGSINSFVVRQSARPVTGQ